MKHTIVLSKSGEVFSWGGNDEGQLGHGDLKDRNEPELIKYFKNKEMVQIGCGYYYSLILSKTGIIYSCGKNEFGQLGHGDLINRNSPKEVIYFKKIIQFLKFFLVIFKFLL